jgi:hypothetical protein
MELVQRSLQVEGFLRKQRHEARLSASHNGLNGFYRRAVDAVSGSNTFHCRCKKVHTKPSIVAWRSADGVSEKGRVRSVRGA